MRIAITTGGGDAPGLNAVIRAVVLSTHQRGWQCYGIRRGYGGLLGVADDGVVHLTPERVRGITHLGGTILGTTNRGNPFRWASKDQAGKEIEVDRSDELIAAFQASGFDALVTIGGDGSLKIGYDLWKKGMPVVGVPKTIDNDVTGTLATFGFDTAVSIATDAIDRLHSTAESHERVMVVELMGRHAGWIALHSGLSASADVILIPELPFDIDKVCDKIRQREAAGRHFSIVVVAEGAKPIGGGETVRASVEGGEYKLGGIGDAAVLNESDEALAAIAREELGRMLGLTVAPISHVIARWPRSMAQYTLGHQQRVAEIKARAAAIPGLHLAGNAYDGIGIPDCINTGRAAAHAAITYAS